MKISYLTFVVLGGLFSLTAIGLSLASFSRNRKVSPRKELHNENKDKVESTPVQGTDLAQTAMGKGGAQVKAVPTSGGGFEGRRVRRVRKYNSNGKPVYE
jgi:hypothetical protein